MPAPPPPADPASDSARAWWTAWLAAWGALVVIQSVQAVLSSLALGGAAHMALGPFVQVRVAELVPQLLLAALALEGVRDLAPARTWGGAARLAAMLLALLPIPFVAALVEAPIRALVAAPIVFRGSWAAKALGDYVTLAGATAAAAALELGGRLAARERQAAELEARLTAARLDALAARLHPHFLFNTLNAVAVLVHRDAAAADAMLTRLAELLRAALRDDGAHEVPLEEELRLTGRYVDIMRVRFPRLAVETRVAPDAVGLLVPAFLLQPLVENALEHGVGRRAGPGRVTIAAARDGGVLRVEVLDDGPGLAPDAGREGGGRGIGLATTRDRLAALYGARARLALERLPGEGTRALVELPARPAPALAEAAS